MLDKKRVATWSEPAVPVWMVENFPPCGSSNTPPLFRSTLCRNKETVSCLPVFSISYGSIDRLQGNIPSQKGNLLSPKAVRLTILLTPQEGKKSLFERTRGIVYLNIMYRF